MKRIAIALVLLMAACTPPAALPPQSSQMQRHTVRPMDNGGGPIGGHAVVAPTPTPIPQVSPADNGGGPIGG